MLFSNLTVSSFHSSHVTKTGQRIIVVVLVHKGFSSPSTCLGSINLQSFFVIRYSSRSNEKASKINSNFKGSEDKAFVVLNIKYHHYKDPFFIFGKDLVNISM